MGRSAYLLLGGEVIARLEELAVDQPWFECRFEATPKFEEVRPLFERELEIVEAPGELDVEAFEATWDDIRDRGVALRLAGGEHLTADRFILHVYDDGTARLRW